jgi:hypothetical protein
MSGPDIACERCGGMGWRRVRHTIRNAEGLYEDRSDYPDCKHCGGYGIEPKSSPPPATPMSDEGE